MITTNTRWAIHTNYFPCFCQAIGSLGIEQIDCPVFFSLLFLWFWFVGGKCQQPHNCQILMLIMSTITRYVCYSNSIFLNHLCIGFVLVLNWNSGHINLRCGNDATQFVRWAISFKFKCHGMKQMCICKSMGHYSKCVSFSCHFWMINGTIRIFSYSIGYEHYNKR